MKILVTGGAGFIGSHLVDDYLKEGHKVVVVDNLSTGKKENLNPKAKFYEADILNHNDIRKIFSREKPEVLNHHAAQINVRKSVEDPEFDAKVNILGFLNLLEQGRKNSLKKVIFASSGGAVYGESRLPAFEDYPTRPLSPYGISKLAGEYYLYFYFQNYGLPYIILRYGNVYGPRQDPFGEAGVVAIFTQQILKGKQPIINGDGKQTRDFVYVGDVMTANILALKKENQGIFNIGTGKETSVNEIFDNLQRIIGTGFEKKYGPKKTGEQQRSLLDIKKARKILKWQPEMTLEAGLTKTVEYFKNNGK